MGRNGDVLLRTPIITTLGLQDFFSSLVFCSWDFLGLLLMFLIRPWTPLMVRKKELRLGAGVYDSWKLQGDVEELWDELAKLGLGLRCCFALVVSRLKKEEKGGDKATWGPSIDLRSTIYKVFGLCAAGLDEFKSIWNFYLVNGGRPGYEIVWSELYFVTSMWHDKQSHWSRCDGDCISVIMGGSWPLTIVSDGVSIDALNSFLTLVWLLVGDYCRMVGVGVTVVDVVVALRCQRVVMFDVVESSFVVKLVCGHLILCTGVYGLVTWIH
ncbi:hypothetical protein Tco_1019885 [Tanacetum coccineum]|uniref:Uncharacterized protein n=1 Tax=Tanacetum coccineum TaxID=301880 RepID=A0ABQ5FYG4_9ASTR